MFIVNFITEFVIMSEWVLVTQLCLILCIPMERSPPGYSVHGDSPDKNGLPFPSPGDLPDSGIQRQSPALQAYYLPYWDTREKLCIRKIFFKNWRMSLLSF